MTITYSLTDGNGSNLTDLTTSFNLSGLNDAPTGSALFVDVDEDRSLSGTLTATDVDGDTLTYAVVQGVSHGTLTLNSDGSYIYTPDSNYYGDDSFTYKANDGTVDSDEITVNFTVWSVNDVPTRNYTPTLPDGTEDVDYVVHASDLLGGFSDIENSPLSIINLAVDHGTISDNGDGTYTVRHDGEYNGIVTLSYDVFDGTNAPSTTMQYNLAAVNDAPYGVENARISYAYKNMSLSFTDADLLQFYGDSDGDDVTLFGLSGSFNSVVLSNGGGNFTFSPLLDFVGQASINYSVTDGQGGTRNVSNYFQVLDSVTGTTGNDTLVGGSSAAGLFGLEGDDTLGKVGKIEHMFGGAGNDTYRYDDYGDLMSETSTSGIDDGGIDTVITGLVNFTLPDFIENLSLTYSGSGTSYGNGLNNTINGNLGSNILYGLGGNDSLNGRGGANTLYGGAGDDIYYINSGLDTASEDGESDGDDGGTDRVISGVSYQLGDYIENLSLTGTPDIDGTGNVLNNTIVGNDGENILRGLGGDDKIIGGTGADTAFGGAGNDIYYVENLGDIASEETVDGVDDGGYDTVRSTVDFTLGNHIEALILSGVGLSGTGNALANSIQGTTGNDTLDGKAGADRLSGGLGDDIYSVDNVGDIIVENTGGGSDTVRSSITYSLNGNLENLTLTGTGHLDATGNIGANQIEGNAGNNRLNGGAGADTLRGMAGDDTYYVDHIDDQALEDVSGVDQGGNDTVRSSVSFGLSSYIESLILTGSDDLYGLGNAQNNAIYGNSGDNLLDGDQGADTLRGGLGDDIYVVDNTADLVIEYDAEGTDTVRSSVSHTLRNFIENLTLSEEDNINGTGNGLDNIIRGNEGNNVLDGRGGADTLYGDAGDDTYLIENANDVAIEYDDEGSDTGGNDRVNSYVDYTLGAYIERLSLLGTGNLSGTGNELSNVITGTIGNNSIEGGAGNDSLNGKEGDDTYVFSGSFGRDTISDISGNDTIEFQGLTAADIVTQVVGTDLYMALREGSLAASKCANRIRIVGGAASTVIENIIYTGGGASSSQLVQMMVTQSGDTSATMTAKDDQKSVAFAVSLPAPKSLF